MNTYNTLHQKGFTLVELAIVLVILGLIAAGILTGKNLIDNSRIRGLIAEGQSYVQAVRLFEDRYGGLPGDLHNAEDIWGAQNTNATTCQQTESVDERTCNGNGDGFINDDGDTTAWERYRAWQHLSNAGFIKGKFTGTWSGSNENNSVPGSNVPGPEYDKTIGFSLSYHFNNNTSVNLQKYGHYSDKLAQNHFVTLGGGHRSTTYADGIALSSRVTFEMDQKMDDGLPNSGVFVVYNANHSSVGDHNNCTRNEATEPEYQLDNELERACAPHFLVP